MTLLAPAFLLGLLAIGLPVWLHRLSSENPNRQPFSSVMFLEPGEPRRVLAKKLQYIILLALRIGLLVLLALAFAGPALRGSMRSLVGDTARLHVIIMDVSASMGHGERWSRAERLADGIIDELGSTDLGQLVATGRVTEVLAEPSLDRSALRRGLDLLEPGLFRIDYGQLMGAMDGLLRGVELPVTIHLVTDLQQTSLPTRFADLAPQLPVDLVLHDVSVPGEANWSADGLAWSPASGEFTASLRSYGSETAEKAVVLQLNGEVVARETIVLPAGEAYQVSFPPLELATGANRVVARLEPGDDLTVDDERFLVVKRPAPRPVLLVTGDPRERDAPFLSAALGTLAVQAFEIDQIDPASLADRTLTDFAFIVVGDAGALADEEAERLGRYVEAGGALLMALARRSTGLDQVPITEHDFLAFDPLGRSAAEFTAVGNLDGTHPALRRVDELRAARFFRFVSIAPAPGDRVMIRLEDGTPLLIEHSLGEGRVLLFASSLDRSWNDLPVQPVFVPFVAELAAYLAGTLGVNADAPLGGLLSARAMGLAGGQIFTPSGDAALGLAGSGGGGDVLVEEIGFYEVVGSGQTELAAVNLDPRESDIRPMAPSALARWQELGAGASEDQPAADLGAMESPPTPLWPWVLALLAVVVFVESWVGNWHLRVRRGVAT